MAKGKRLGSSVVSELELSDGFLGTATFPIEAWNSLIEGRRIIS
jgi:hypothetical protein